jgi:non-ribosomal peptide synthetase component F
VHQFFEQQVAQTPDSIALVLEDCQLSYQQLNEQANQLASRLLGAGVGPDVLVGVYMERCLELVIAILAILKAGGAYVPLDPELPQERLTFLLSDAQVPIVLTQTHLQASMKQACSLLPEMQMICPALRLLQYQTYALHSLNRVWGHSPLRKPCQPGAT